MNQVKNHRVVVTRPGGPEVLECVEEDLPEPGPEEAARARELLERGGHAGKVVLTAAS